MGKFTNVQIKTEEQLETKTSSISFNIKIDVRYDRIDVQIAEKTTETLLIAKALMDLLKENIKKTVNSYITTLEKQIDSLIEIYHTSMSALQELRLFEAKLIEEKPAAPTLSMSISITCKDLSRNEISVLRFKHIDEIKNIILCMEENCVEFMKKPKTKRVFKPKELNMKVQDILQTICKNKKMLAEVRTINREKGEALIVIKH